MGTTRPKRPTAAERRAARLAHQVEELQGLIAERDAEITAFSELTVNLKSQVVKSLGQLAEVDCDRQSAVRAKNDALGKLEQLQMRVAEVDLLDVEGVAYARCVAVLDPIRSTRWLARGAGESASVDDTTAIERVLRFLAIRYSIDLTKAGA